MQIGGVGGEHNQNVHHVSTCMHNHSTEPKKNGGAAAGPGSQQYSAQVQEQTLQEVLNEWFTPGWMRRPLEYIRGKFFGQVIPGNDGNHTAAAEKAGAVIVTPPKSAEGKPYFEAIPAAGAQQSMWQKVKVKFEAATGRFARRFSFLNQFSNQKFFQAKEEREHTRERQTKDLRKRSCYKGEDMEIDCILTDDSYLLDSYDRRGEYRKLSVKK